jgi:hypothetical protein
MGMQTGANRCKFASLGEDCRIKSKTSNSPQIRENTLQRRKFLQHGGHANSRPQYAMTDYYELLARLQKLLQPKTYVEIGVRNGQSFALAKSAVHSVAIDPVPELHHALPPGAKMFKLTSDDFFANHNLKTELGNNAVDLAFIDGMHLFEFALRDFINLEKYSTPNSTILLHDCYPQDSASSARERTTTIWSGDVWKVVTCLKKYRPDLQLVTVDAPPTGLAVIRRLDPASTVLSQNLEAICAEFIPRQYEEIAANKPAQLNRMDNNWAQVQQLFPDHQKPGFFSRLFGSSN